MRKLKYHEQKLLKKVDFLEWKSDRNIREIKVISYTESGAQLMESIMRVERTYLSMSSSGGISASPTLCAEIESCLVHMIRNFS